MPELVNEAKLGVAKGTAVEDAVSQNFRGETAEVGLYLAMARQAEREGYPEVARALVDIGWEEAQHAALYAELNGLIAANTKDNLQKMLAGETAANKGKKLVGTKSLEELCKALARPRKIILFGSVVRGTANTDSDLDILVVTSEDVRSCREESVRIRRALRGTSMPMDILVISEARLHELGDRAGLVYREALRHGRVVYEAAR